jgi:hypothetical protein
MALASLLHLQYWQSYIKCSLCFSFEIQNIIFFIVVLGGGTLWHIQRFLQCTKYITLEYFLCLSKEKSMCVCTVGT